MKKKMWLSDVEIKEIRNKVENEYSNGDTGTDQNIPTQRNQQIDEQTNHQIETTILGTSVHNDSENELIVEIRECVSKPITRLPTMYVNKLKL